jgi:hypothetical protein
MSLTRHTEKIVSKQLDEEAGTFDEERALSETGKNRLSLIWSPLPAAARTYHEQRL